MEDCLYFFEVQFYNGKGQYSHVGYMNKLFFSIQEANLFYRKYNPSQKGLDENGISDYNPRSKLRYKLQKYNCEKLDVMSWDNPILNRRLPYQLKSTDALIEYYSTPSKPKLQQFHLCTAKLCWCNYCSFTIKVKPSYYSRKDYTEAEMQNDKTIMSIYSLAIL